MYDDVLMELLHSINSILQDMHILPTKESAWSRILKAEELAHSGIIVVRHAALNMRLENVILLQLK